MKRDSMALRIKPGMKDEFKYRCKEICSGLLAPLNLRQVKNLSIWCVEDLVFCYSEVHGDPVALEEEKVLTERLPEYFMDCCECLATPLRNPMRLMYEDIGIVREDKSGIRNKVFVTRLKPGCAEKYKSDHDELAASRGDKISAGPTSNFTIWNTGDYIFGYYESDKSMERESTDEEKQATIAWQNRMLKIMDWITDDVDWLTGQKHNKIELVLWKDSI